MGGAGDAVCIATSSEVESYLLYVTFYLSFYLTFNLTFYEYLGCRACRNGRREAVTEAVAGSAETVAGTAETIAGPAETTARRVEMVAGTPPLRMGGAGATQFA